MTAIAIDRFKARYRLPRAAAGEQARLRRITSLAVERVLEDALDRAGVGRHGHLCIRDLRATARLRLGEPDAALAEQLAEAIAQAIGAAAGVAAGAAEGPGGDEDAGVIYYRSRAGALVDVAVAALAGRFGRSWAWSQIGLWRADFPLPASLAADLVVHALAREPRHASAVVAHLARAHEGAFADLVTRATPNVWRELARAVLAAAGARASLAEPAVERRAPDSRVAADVDARATGAAPPLAAHDGTADGVPEDDAAPTSAAVRPPIDRSAIARAFVRHPRHAAPDAVHALALLALIETEPAVLGDDTRAEASIAALARAFTFRRRDFAARDRRVVDRDESAGAAPAPRIDPSAPGSCDLETLPAPPGPARSDAAASSDADTVAARDVPAPGDAPLDDSGLAPTAFGGLLFVLNLVGRLGLPDAILADPRWIDRGVRWVLHQLGQRLTGADRADPAVLAFAGLPPVALAPDRDLDAPSDADARALDGYRAVIVAALRDALGADDEPERALVDRICRRGARIAADPGWIEARLSLDEVAIDVRRAGLDFDPGWLPWLGVVVRFVYE